MLLDELQLVYEHDGICLFETAPDETGLDRDGDLGLRRAIAEDVRGNEDRGPVFCTVGMVKESLGRILMIFAVLRGR